MLKRLIQWMVILFLSLPVMAEVGVLSVSDEDKHTHKEDFWHTFEYYIIPSKGIPSKCQATRVAKNWFATAAHCVIPQCNNGCTLRLDLLEQPVSVFISAEHTVKKPIIFAHPGYNLQTAIPVGHDFALFRMNLSVLPAVYYMRPTKDQSKNVSISRAAFQDYLARHPVAQREFNRALRPALPPLLVFDNVTKRIDRKLSVVSIFDGKRAILQNPYPTDYVKELDFAYTQNFGVRRGMSGSGVMTNTGELAGIISAYLGMKGSDKQEKEYFMFAVFNKELTDFMEEVMGSDYYKIDRRDSFPNYVVRSPKNHRDIIEMVKGLNQPIVKESKK